jgi:hypothetical protein
MVTAPSEVARFIAGLLLTTALMNAASAQTTASSPSNVSERIKGATHYWTGTIRLDTTYYSEQQGTPDLHFWTTEYYVLLAEVPTTSKRTRLEGGKLIDVPVNNLVPLQLDYRIDAFTLESPAGKGPIEGGHKAIGTARGKLRGDALSRLSSDRARGSFNRVATPQTSAQPPSSWNNIGARLESLSTTMDYEGAYEITIGLIGTGAWTRAEEKALFNGISLTYLPCGLARLDQSSAAALTTDHGFLNLMVAADVLIFGKLTMPDQSEIRGTHTFDRFDSSGTPSPRDVVYWDLKRIPYRGPLASVEYSQQRADGSRQWQRAADFVDFLVGQAQPSIEVRITTVPEEAEVWWALEATGNHSGRVAPTMGRTMQFSFTPDVSRVRIVRGSQQPHPNGSQRANPPIGYTVTLTDPDSRSELLRETIRQDAISALRQEYVDYGWRPPERIDIGPPPPLPAGIQLDPNFSWGNYAPITLNGGWLLLAQQTQAALGGNIEINSAFRNPQRNRAINGARRSVHMTGGAVDMDPVPANATNMVQLHRAALAGSGAANILLERQGGRQGGELLVPKNWGPPPARHGFTLGMATIEVEDSNADDLPDRVAQIDGAPRRGIPSATDLPYAGGGVANPPFRVTDTNDNGRIDVGEPLVLRYALDGRAENALIRYYRAATHVHCDNGQLVRPLAGR